MERKIGEIFECNGEWYQCVFAIQGCRECPFRTHDYCTCHSECLSYVRSDKTSVIFKKLEKVGEPYELLIDTNKKVLMQEYKIYGDMYIWENKGVLHTDCFNGIRIEIKQNKKEDMEGKKQKWGVSSDTINEINKEIEPMNTSRNIDTERSGAEGIRRNLNPFNLEAAKAGKPVCTRDGRKARIICFDREFIYKGQNYCIVALINDGSYSESLYSYTEDGLFNPNKIHNYDLMMLPEKKEGWVNICRNLNTNKTELDTKDIYNTKEEALQNLSSMTYVTTVKIEWEE